MEATQVTGTAEEYDIILRHLLSKAMKMSEESLMGGQRFVTDDDRRVGLGHFPPMVALAEAALDVIVYRWKLGKHPDVTLEELQEKRQALAMIKLISAFTWASMREDELAEGGTD